MVRMRRVDSLPMEPKVEYVRGLFTRIAGMYDALNHVLTFGIDVIWRRRALAMLADGSCPSTVLDLATGTADLAIAAARRFPSAHVTGIDLTPAMLAVGRRKVESAGLADRIALREGNALALDVPDGAYDAVTCAFGFRNFPDPDQALREAARVLRPGGRLLVLELFRMRSRFFSRFTSIWLRCVASLFARRARNDYAYLRTSIERTLSAAEFQDKARRTGLERVREAFFRPSCHCLVLRKI